MIAYPVGGSGPECLTIGTVHTMSHTTSQGRYWILKTEPNVYSFEDLLRDGSTEWDGVRNYQARNHLRAMEVGDYIIVYHSNAMPPGAAGIGRVGAVGRPDRSQFDPESAYHDPRSTPDVPRWTSVIVTAVCPLQLVPLDRLREMRELEGCELVRRGSRLSVSELTAGAFDAICRAGGAAIATC